MNRVAIVPVKRLSKAKMRLCKVLRPKERRVIAEMMLKDVLQALQYSELLDDIIVVGADKPVEMLAKIYQAGFVKEPSVGLNISIEYATERSRKNGATSVLVMLADVPLVNENDVEQMVQLGLDAAVVISPSRTEGTNALLRTPPDAIRTEYGHKSFVNHLKGTKEKDIPFKVLWTPSLSFDVDTPGDLWKLLERPVETHTAKFLESIGMLKRLTRYWRKVKRAP
jgi:FO synthase/2-phospho-L-lactate guanylyltransferase